MARRDSAEPSVRDRESKGIVKTRFEGRLNTDCFYLGDVSIFHKYILGAIIVRQTKTYNNYRFYVLTINNRSRQLIKTLYTFYDNTNLYTIKNDYLTNLTKTVYNNILNIFVAK